MIAKISSIIVIAVVFAIVAISSTYAIYMSSGSTNVDVQLADWQVFVLNTEQSDDISIVSGVTTSNYLLQVKSLSDVTVGYTVELTNLPDGVEVSIDGGSFVSEVNNAVTFNNVGTIGVNDTLKTKDHTISFRAPLGTAEVSNIGVNINVKFEQIL